MILFRTLIVFLTAAYSLFAQVTSDTTKTDNGSLIIADSVDVNDTLAAKDISVITDSTLFLQSPLYQNSFFITREVFLKNDYTYTGDIINPFQFSFLKDLALPGQPNESFVYGAGHNGISFLLDGIFYNDRQSNNLDLYLIQNEDIDRIEVVPSPRGFLYGPVNNPAAVNFITRDFFTTQPYSRIKYFQGPDGEAMVDGSFNAAFSRNFHFSFDVTNYKYDSTYLNTGFSIWLAKVKAKYFFSNKLFFSATYNFADKNTGLWGGVNRDSIVSGGLMLEDLWYEPNLAPVNHPFRKKDDLLHFTSAKLVYLPGQLSRTELNAYHSFKESKTENSSYNEYDNTTFGADIKQTLSFSPLVLSFSGDYERNILENWQRFYSQPYSIKSYNKGFLNLAAFSVIALMQLSRTLIPSVFYKVSNSKIKSAETEADYTSSGYGADIAYSPLDNFSIYLGYSEFEKSFLSDDKTKNFEAAVVLNSENLFGDLRYFRRENTNLFTHPVVWPFVEEETVNISGLGFSAVLKLWYLQIETQTSAYFANDNELYHVPELSFTGGLYFKGKLFENNLDLKSGFKFNHKGKITSVTDEYGILNIDPFYTIDFVLSGEINKSAIVYFTIENLLDKQYYITPYYPMPGISLRFGLAWEFLN